MKDQLDKEQTRAPFPPFNRETAIEKIRMAENAWNTKAPEKVALAYSIDSQWRNRDTFINGRAEIVGFLTAKWKKEQHYKLVKELWAFSEDKIAVRFVYEWQAQSGQWYRSHGNENWRFDNKGLMVERHASINDVKIDVNERKLLWQGDIRPEEYAGLTELGL